MTQTVRLQSHSDMLVGFSLFGKNSWGDSHSGESQIRTRYLDAVSQSTVDFVTEAFYPALGAACNPAWKCDADNFNLLSSPIDQQINSWKSTLKFNYNDLMKSKGRIVYEWGVAGNNNKAYAMVPMAREMRQAGVQAAAFFQYDTRSSAQLNGIYSDYEAPSLPEVYNIHFLNLYHSPSQAIDFFAARKAFWNIPLWGQYKAPSHDQWAWATFSSYKNNFSVASDPWSYAQSRSTTSYNPVEWFYLQDVGDIVTCVGSCRYWNYEGTGAVRFEVINDREATLTVCPDVTRLRTTLYADSANPNQPITQLSSGTVRTLKFINGLAGDKQIEFTVPTICSVVSTVSW